MSVVACPPNTPPVHGVVQFVLAEWTAAYPEFAGITQLQGQAAFNDATLLMSNSCRSLIRDANKRQLLLYLLTCHVCFLRFGSNDGAGNVVPAPGVVGRIASATEGSVSAQVQVEGTNQNRAYFVQTKWGFQFWQATARYRTMRYALPPMQSCSGCGSPAGMCTCGAGLGPVGTGWPGYNGGSS